MLVESLDRLSREKVGEAIERLKLILNHGIDVITLCDNTVYNIDSLNEPYSLIKAGNDSNLLIVFYVQIMPDDFVMQLHRF